MRIDSGALRVIILSSESCSILSDASVSSLALSSSALRSASVLSSLNRRAFMFTPHSIVFSWLPISGPAGGAAVFWLAVMFADFCASSETLDVDADAGVSRRTASIRSFFWKDLRVLTGAPLLSSPSIGASFFGLFRRRALRETPPLDPIVSSMPQHPRPPAPSAEHRRAQGSASTSLLSDRSK